MDFVAGVGGLNVDLLFSGLDRLPRMGEELYARGFALQLGGGLPATLINLARLGVPVRLGTFLGDHPFSRFAETELNRYGVEYLNLHDGGGLPLTVTAVMITPEDRTFVSYHDPVVCVSDLEEREYPVMRGAKIVEMVSQGSIQLYRRLKDEGSSLVLDTGWHDDLTLERYADLLELADYYTPSRQEALKITGASTLAEAARILGHYFDPVLIKLDRYGCLIVRDGVPTVIPTLPDVQAVDSTGAGDAFLSGLLCGLYEGAAFEECVRYGNVTGGTCVQGVGCLTRYVDRAGLRAGVETLRDAVPDPRAYELLDSPLQG